MPLHTHARLAPGQPPSASHTTGISRQRRALEGCHINGADVQGERLSAIRQLCCFCSTVHSLCSSGKQAIFMQQAAASTTTLLPMLVCHASH